MKLLVVDDSKLMQKSVIKFFGECLPEAEFILASDGEEGYTIFKDVQPEIMTIDLLMPRVSGLELLKKISQEPHSTKLFVISADVQKAVQQEVESLGAIFISKPLTPDKAREIVKLIKG